MNKNQEFFLKSKLFANVPRKEAEEYCKTVSVGYGYYRKGGIIVMQGEPVSRIGFICSGRAVGERIRSDGFAVTVSELSAGDLFGDVLSGSSAKSPVTVRAETAVEAVFVELSELLMPRPQFAATSAAVVKALIAEISDKYFAQNERIMILTAGSIKSRVARYLIKYSKGEDRFSVPHSREAMARYLGSDRSALSRELSNLKNAGIIDYRRSDFVIMDRERLSAL